MGAQGGRSSLDRAHCPPRLAAQALLGFTILTGCAGAAWGDSLLPVKQVSVANRPRPEYEPMGVRMGSMRISPSLSVGESYNDNIFAEHKPMLSDKITTAEGSVSLSSETRIPWSVFGNVTTEKYADHSSEDHSDWSGGASISQIFWRRTRATLSGTLAQAHTARDDASFPADAAELPILNTHNVKLDFVHPFASGQLSLSTYLESNDYEDAKLVGGGKFDQDFRDRHVWNIDARTDFAVGATTALFVRLSHGEQRYRNNDDAAGLDRDATNDAVYGGTAFMISNLMRADVGVGVLRVDNEDPSQKDRTSLALAGNLEFYMSQLMTATLELRRSSGAADIEGSSSFIATTGSVGLDYELRRNVILSLSYSRSQRDYSGLNDTDDMTDYAFSAKWFLNRRARVSLQLAHDDQDWDASSPGTQFKQNVYSLTFDFTL
ncbi:MAG: outer membrane beta-barrel protein [Steroidobacteraceae bacterium]